MPRIESILSTACYDGTLRRALLIRREMGAVRRESVLAHFGRLKEVRH